MTTRAAALLRSGRAASGLSQRALSALAATDRPAISAIESGSRDPSVGVLGRLLAATGHQLISVPTSVAPVAVFADEIRERLAHADHVAAFRLFIALSDALSSQEPDVKVVLTLTQPASTGSARFNALIAAVVEHHLGQERLPIPDWVNDRSRFLDQEWFVDDSPYGLAHDRDASPPAFSRRNVFLAPTELASV